MVERSGTPTPTVLCAQTELAAVSIAGTQTNLTFTPPSGQLIGNLAEAWRLSTRPEAGAYVLTARGFGRAMESQAWVQLELVVDGDKTEQRWRRVAGRPF